MLFLIAAGAVQSSHAMLYIFGTLHWQQLGYSTTWCGLLWAISIVAEIGLFVWSAAFARYLSAVGLMIFGAAAAIVRWVLLGFDPPLALLLPLQALHAATYAAAHLGAMQFLARAAPEGTGGVAQALYATVAGALAMALAVQMAGQAYVAAAGKAYWAMALLAGISLVAALALHSRWDGGVVAVQNRRSQ